MLGKIRQLVGDLANAVTLWGLVGTVGVSGVLGIVGPTILQPILGLPAGVRVALGFCIFLVALAVILASLNAFLQRPSQGKGTQDPAPQSPEYSLWRELKRVETENSQLRTTLQQRGQEVEQLRDWIGKIEPFKQHMQLRFMLQAIWRMGNNLCKSEHPDVAAKEKWVSLTSALIRRTLGDETANFFLVDDGDSSFDGRLNRLDHISGNQALEMSTDIPPDFDITTAIDPYPMEWTNRF